jgi:hypothetical protein
VLAALRRPCEQCDKCATQHGGSIEQKRGVFNCEEAHGPAERAHECCKRVGTNERAMLHTVLERAARNRAQERRRCARLREQIKRSEQQAGVDETGDQRAKVDEEAEVRSVDARRCSGALRGERWEC